MFVVRVKNVPGEDGFAYLLDPATRKPKRFETNSAALDFILKNCESEEVLKDLKPEIIDEETDSISIIAKYDDGLVCHRQILN